MERRERVQTPRAVPQSIGIAALRRGPTLSSETLEQGVYMPNAASLSAGIQQLDISKSKIPVALSATQLATIGRIPMHTTLMPPANDPCPRGQELPDKKKKKRRRRKKKSIDAAGQEAAIVEK